MPKRSYEELGWTSSRITVTLPTEDWQLLKQTAICARCAPADLLTGLFRWWMTMPTVERARLIVFVKAGQTMDRAAGDEQLGLPCLPPLDWPRETGE